LSRVLGIFDQGEVIFGEVEKNSHGCMDAWMLNGIKNNLTYQLNIEMGKKHQVFYLES